MKKHHDLLQRLAAAAVCAAMLMSLTACTKAPAETTAPPETVVNTVPATQPQPPESTAAAPETTQAVQIDYTNLVTDAYCYTFQSEYDTQWCYHIPKVNLVSCASFNDEIYRTLREIIDRDVLESLQEYDYAALWRMIYVWNHKNDVVSILVEASASDVEWEDYYVYYITPQTGTQVGRAELLDACGLSEQEFFDQVYAALKAYWDEFLNNGIGQASDQLSEMSLQMMEQTLAEENIHAALPFINADGRLSFVATVYVPAGGGEFKGLFDCGTGAMLTHFNCTADHTSDIAP